MRGAGGAGGGVVIDGGARRRGDDGRHWDGAACGWGRVVHFTK